MIHSRYQVAAETSILGSRLTRGLLLEIITPFRSTGHHNAHSPSCTVEQTTPPVPRYTSGDWQYPLDSNVSILSTLAPLSYLRVFRILRIHLFRWTRPTKQHARVEIPRLSGSLTHLATPSRLGPPNRPLHLVLLSPLALRQRVGPRAYKEQIPPHQRQSQPHSLTLPYAQQPLQSYRLSRIPLLPDAASLPRIQGAILA